MVREFLHSFNYEYLHILTMLHHQCLKCIQVDWTGGLLLDYMEHVINLPLKGQISLWRSPREPHQIQILSSILENIMYLSNTEVATSNHICPLITNQIKTVCRSTDKEDIIH